MKTGSLFNCECPDRAELIRELCGLNRRLTPKGLRVVPLRFSEKRALIYLYRPSLLERDLADSSAAEILLSCGYSGGGYLARLRKRLRASQSFPHEIGLFLGYPPEDVRGFIENRAACAKCVGCWKVYGDAEKADRLFAKYKKCTEIYRSQWEKGKSIERLTVACR